MHFLKTIQKYKNHFFLLGTFMFLGFTFVLPLRTVEARSSSGLYFAEVSGDDKYACSDIDNCAFIDKYINPLITFLTAGIGIIITMMIIIGGIQYSSAGDDPQKVAAAKKKITNAILALVLYIFLAAILNWLVPGGVI